MTTHPLDDQPPAPQRTAALDRAINALRDERPEASAVVPVIRWQRVVLIGIAAVLLAGLVFALRPTLIVVTLTATLLYLATVVQRVVLFVAGLDTRTILSVPDEVALSVPDSELPRYTVLVPAYGEPGVVPELIRNLGALDYPADRLEILLLLEEDDAVTVDAAREAGVVAPMRLLLVPPAEPRTKPKACNYGMQFATGELITIYDAEDSPEPLQLRRAVVLFRDHPELACIQAKLAFHNSGQNLLTGWFAAEYGLWFGYLLPGLARSKGPVPLGGTSNHIRAAALAEVGGWDPFNVTEDADLGVRLARLGHRTGVLDSTTLEEANSDAINWIRQRSRWYKGYLQSWLVAMRTPVQTVRAIGVKGALAMTLLLAGTPVASCANLLFWMITVAWILGQPAIIADAFPGYVYYLALINIVVGNTLALYSNLIGARASKEYGLLVPCLLNFLYWVLMAIAAMKGIWQLVARPSYWEKTVHGLHVTSTAALADVSMPGAAGADLAPTPAAAGVTSMDGP